MFNKKYASFWMCSFNELNQISEIWSRYSIQRYDTGKHNFTKHNAIYSLLSNIPKR